MVSSSGLSFFFWLLLCVVCAPFSVPFALNPFLLLFVLELPGASRKLSVSFLPSVFCMLLGFPHRRAFRFRSGRLHCSAFLFRRSSWRCSARSSAFLTKQESWTSPSGSPR